MPLSEAVNVIFDNTENLLSANLISGDALLKYEEKLIKVIEQKNKAMAVAVNSGAISAELRGLRALLLFFKYLKKHLQEKRSLYVWLIDWKLSINYDELNEQNKHLLSVELNHLMKGFLEFNEKAAIEYYGMQKDRLDGASYTLKIYMEEILNQKKESKLAQDKALEAWEEYFDDALKGQVAEPTTILCLMLHYYDQPDAFVAILFWLLRHGVTPHTIIYSGLLHTFFSGHAAYMESTPEESPVAKVYSILNASNNEAAITLYKLAKSMSAYVYNNARMEALRGFQAYDLTGQQYTEEMRIASPEGKLKALIVLSQEEITNPTESVICDFENVRALSLAFSSSFLKLLSKNRALGEHFTEEQWQGYFYLMADEIGDDLTSFSAWLDLYALFNRHQSGVRKQVFSKILDLIFMYHQQIDGDPVIAYIKLFFMNSVARDMVFMRAEELFLPISDFLIFLGRNLGAITLDRYQAAEDAWRKMSGAAEFFKYNFRLDFTFLESKHILGDINSVFPKNIYQLQVTFLTKYVGTLEALSDFLCMMLSSHVSEENSKAHEKRLLAEWYFQDGRIEMERFIIDRLFEKYTVEELQDLNCDLGNCFEVACKLGNLFWVKHFLSNKVPLVSEYFINNGFMLAVRYGHKDILTCILNVLFGLKGGFVLIKENINSALLALVTLDPLDVVMFLCEQQGDLAPSNEAINHVLKLAVERGEVRAVTRLCDLKAGNAPRRKTIGEMLKIAVNLDVLNFLLSFIRPLALSHLMVGDALDAAVNGKQWQKVIMLCRLNDCNLPPRGFIEKAVVAAMKEGDVNIINALCGLIGSHPFSESITVMALDYAISQGDLNFITKVCNLEGGKAIDQRHISSALNKACKENNMLIARFFCGLKSANAPDYQSISAALSYAVYYGNIELVTFLCGMNGANAPNAQSVTNALKRLDVVLAGYFTAVNNFFADDPGRVSRVFNAVAVLCYLKGHKTVEKNIFFNVLSAFCKQKKLNCIKVVCGLHDGGIPNHEAIAEVLIYAEKNRFNDIVAGVFNQMIIKLNEQAYPIILNYLQATFTGKTVSEKYQFMAIFYEHSIMTVESAALSFNLIDLSYRELGIDTAPRRESWAPGFLRKTQNDGEIWAAAWGRVRKFIFNQWRKDIDSSFTAPERKQALIAFFEGCGESDSPHHKLMGMGRTSGKPNSKTSQLIEAEIAKVRCELVPPRLN